MGDWRTEGTEEQCWLSLAALRDEVVAIVSWRLGGGDDVEDDVHEAMLRLAGKPGLDLDRRRLRALLVKVAVDVAAERRRRSARRERLLPRVADVMLEPPASQEDSATDRVEIAAVERLLPTLARLERTALAYAARGFGVGEIPALLGVGYKSVENALGRARRKLEASIRRPVVVFTEMVRRFQRHGPSTPAVAAAAVVLVLGLFRGPANEPHGASDLGSHRPTASSPDVFSGEPIPAAARASLPRGPGFHSSAIAPSG